ncbi:MAG: ATP-binding protein [Candidatus Zambryskibacteria bacterium]
MNIALPSSATMFPLFITILFVLAVLVFYFYYSLKKREKEITKEREESTRNLYELAILKELGERTGYSLNVEEILQIITGSLRQFIDYTAVGYIVIAPEKLKINTHIEKPVSDLFIKEMKNRMIASLSALTDKSFDSFVLDEIVSGAIVIDEIKQSIGSLFNIPIVIGGKVVGVLSVAHIDSGLYKEEDMTILYKITGQASEAVSRLEEVVEMEKGKLNAMVESMEDGVLMVDAEYRIVVANPAVKKIIRFSSTDNANKDLNIFNFVDALGGKFDIHGRLEEALVNKKSFVSERININDSFFEIGVYPVLHFLAKGGNQILGAVVVFNDITRDIELEKVREEFTGMIVHELRSPLDGIKKIMELAVSGSVDKNSDQFREYLNMVHQSSSSMLELVNDILDLSKLQAGKFEVNKEKANIKEVIENRISFYKILADSKKIYLEPHFDKNLPQLVEFDTQAVKQILNNFLSNALKFTKEGGSILISAFAYDPQKAFPEDLDKSKVSVLPEAKDIAVKMPSLCVVVSDNGLGIPEDSMKDLFHTFKQAKLSPIDKESKGTGLGLVIAKGITEAHGGTIGVVSKEGIGTSFFFTIPL